MRQMAWFGTMFLVVNYALSTIQQLFDFSSSGLRTYNRAFGDASDMLAILERESIAYVPQEPLLFHRSIAGNIAYGRLDAEPMEIEPARPGSDVMSIAAESGVSMR